MKLKELLIKDLEEGVCERLPDETDNEFLTRCANRIYQPKGSLAQNANAPVVMKKRVVVPIPIKGNINQRG
jgi:hypothetical protein